MRSRAYCARPSICDHWALRYMSRYPDQVVSLKRDSRCLSRQASLVFVHQPTAGAHVTTLEEDLKQQPLCQDSPKDVLSDSGLEIKLAIPFVPNRDPPDTPQQSELGEVVHYHPSE
ncbi:uncharacterized protein TNCV_2360661 [Trichonephila clavipes]|nr:uncharacterized protein TNCV_2360661 [Trichonephila clavipes]